MKFLAHQVDRFAVFVFLVVTIRVFWPPEAYFGSPLAQATAAQSYLSSTVFNGALIAFLAIACLARAEAVMPVLRSAWPILPLLLLAYLSAGWSPSPEAVALRATKVAATALLGVYLVARSDMAELVALFVKANLVAAAASFLIAFAVPALALSTVTEYAHAWRGAFTDKNELGVVCAIGMLFAVYAFRCGYGSRLLSGLAILANAVLLYLSASMTSMLLLPIALYVAVLGSALRRRSGLGLLAGFAVIVVGLLAAVIALGLFDQLLEALGRNPTLSQRTRIWHLVVPYIALRPWFGYGYEMFWQPNSVGANTISTLLYWRVPHAHNLWLELALSLGLVGAFLASFIWLDAFWRAARQLLGGAAPHAVFSLVLLAAIFADNFTEYRFFRGDDLAWLLFAVAFTQLRQREREPAVRRAPLPLRVAPLRRPLAAHRAAR